MVPRGHDVVRDRVPTRRLVSIGRVKNNTDLRSDLSPGNLGRVRGQAASHPSAKLLKTRVWWVTAGTTYAVGKSKATLQFSGYTGHELGVAASVSGKFGSFTATSMKKTSDAWGFSRDMIGGSRSHQIEVQYGYYHVPYNCINMMGEVVCDWRYEWRPRKQTGGTKTVKITSGRPDWRKNRDRCTKNQEPGSWWRENANHKAYTFGAAVKAKDSIGIELGISRQYSTSAGNSSKHYYEIRTGKRKILCGNNEYPTRSGKQAEYFK